MRQVDAVLEPGDLTETNTVSAAPPLLNTADSTVGTDITLDGSRGPTRLTRSLFGQGVESACRDEQMFTPVAQQAGDPMC